MAVTMVMMCRSQLSMDAQIHTTPAEGQVAWHGSALYQTWHRSSRVDTACWELPKRLKLHVCVSMCVCVCVSKAWKHFELFYKRLYCKISEDNEDQIDSFLEMLELPLLTEDQNKALNAEINILELNEAITRLKANKLLGRDGFTTEWYKAFREELMPILLTTCNWALKKGLTPPTWKEAIVSLIPKEGKERTKCGSYRPISILNVDYRIYTSIMARRMEKFLPNLIHNDQTGFIHMCQTHDNIKRTLRITDHIRQHKVKAMILSLDAEKAFDSVSWQYLYKVLLK